jgi:hypothetical protein
MNKIIKNSNGVALLMVLTAITILTAVLADFTFDGKINKIKVINAEEKAQAKLNAEAGIALSVARLRLYKDIFNILQKNKDAKDFVTQQVLNQVWEFPFMFPLPIDKKMLANQKAAIEKFQKESFLTGELQVSIKNHSNKINLNLLRAPIVVNSDDSKETEEEKKEISDTVDYQIYELFQNAIRRKNETDQEFYDKYRYIDDPQIFVTAMKYYVSEPNSFQDNFSEIIRGKFQELDLDSKFSIFSSNSELYLLPELDDTLIDLIIKDVTTHGNAMIDLNKITDSMLRLLIPGISDEDVTKFFEYRDNPKTPHFFNNEEDFKNYITSSGMMNETEYAERFEKFKKAGIKFGPSPTLFEVESTGVVGRTSYTLKAMVAIPSIDEVIEKEGEKDKETEQTSQTTSTTSEESQDESQDQSEKTESEEDKNKKKETRLKLLEPRVQEIYTE